MKGRVVSVPFNQQRELHLYLHFPSHTSCTHLAARAGAVFPSSWQFPKAKPSSPSGIPSHQEAGVGIKA